jgi:hypothetical protein
MIKKQLFTSSMIMIVLWCFSAFAAAVGDSNVALKKTAVCSSTESAALGASLAVDGTISWASRWGSAFADSQWIYIDFGKSYTIDSVAIYWEHSGAKYFDLQTLKTGITVPAGNDQSWTTFHHDSTFYQDPPVDMCLNFLKLSPLTTRYFRIRCLKRLWQWGYGVIELQVFGIPSGTPVAKPAGRGTMQKLRFTRLDAGVSIKANGCLLNDMDTRIYSSQGQLVRRISGNTAVLWNLRDDSGNRTANGTYMIRVSIAGRIFQDKIVIY